MGRYRKIDPRIWNDEAFRALSDRGKLVFLFILTHPHMTSLGAMRASTLGLAAELVAVVGRTDPGWVGHLCGVVFRDRTAAGTFQDLTPPTNGQDRTSRS